MLEVPQLATKQIVQVPTSPQHSRTHLLSWRLSPVLSAQMVNILKLFPKIQEFVGLPGSISMMSTVSSSTSRRREELSQVGKWVSVYRRLWLLVIAALMRDVTQGSQGPEDY